MSFKVKFNNTSQINKPFYQAILEGLYIGNLLNLKIKDYPVIKSIKNIFKLAFSKPVLATLKETEVRSVGDYTLIGKRIIKYFQIQTPYLVNHSDDNQVKMYNQYSLFIENLRSFQDIDVFYYDRPEQINDYNYYFKQLDNKIQATANFETKSGKVLGRNLREGMPSYIEEMFNVYNCRAREAFLVVSTDITGMTINDLENSKNKLDSKIFKVVTSLKEMNVKVFEVKGEHKQWLFTNFISNTTNY
jgi:hypothetical protein